LVCFPDFSNDDYFGDKKNLIKDWIRRIFEYEPKSEFMQSIIDHILFAITSL